MSSPLFVPRTLLTIVLAGAMLFALSVAASADTITGSSAVTGGALSLSAADAPAVAITLDGTNQTVSDPFNISVNDLRGSGAGWNLEITSTAFSNGTKSLANNASQITAVAVACDQGTCTSPSNSITYPLTVPAGATAPAAVKLFNAAVDSGMGDFTVTPTFTVNIPANTYAGNYSSTITISLSTGP